MTSPSVSSPHESNGGVFGTPGIAVAAAALLTALVLPLMLSLAEASRASTTQGTNTSHSTDKPISRGRPEARLPVSRAAGREETPVAGTGLSALAAQELERAPEPGGVPTAAPEGLATFADVSLVVPAAGNVEAVVGFHQAGARSGAETLSPLGTTVTSAVPKFAPESGPDEVAARGSAGHAHHVLAYRGRGTHATSAVDVALPTDASVLSPVTGVVATVAPYNLYGKSRDLTIAIVPDDASGHAVQLFHLDEPVVEEGQRVEAGVTPLASVRTLPMRSQIDRITTDGRPHVHLEIREQ